MVISLQLHNKAVTSVVKSGWPGVGPGLHSLPGPCCVRPALAASARSLLRSPGPCCVRLAPATFARPLLRSPGHLEIHFIVVATARMPPVLEGASGREGVIFPFMQSRLPLF